MTLKNTFSTLILLISIIFSCSYPANAQQEITPLQPANNAININVGILKWTGQAGSQFDLYFGTTQNPPLYKSNIQTNEEKPVILELNKTYYWKVVEKKANKEVRTSKIFTFSTLPIPLNPQRTYHSFVDIRDYKVYWTININGKEWFVQNLDYDLQGRSFYYDTTETNKVYGKLYIGTSIRQNQKDICPEGWHIPTLEEWNELIEANGGRTVAGSKLKHPADTFWRKSEVLCTNESGMSVLPSGSRDSKPSFANLGKYCFFWTSTPDVKKPNSFMKIDFGFMRDNINNSSGDENWSYSIRCVKD